MNSELLESLLKLIYALLAFLKLVSISLACAFIANVVTRQNGPMMIFSAFRMLVGKWAAIKSHSIGAELTKSKAEWRQKKLARKIKFYKSMAEIIACPFCLGPWLVLLFVAIFASDQIIHNWLVTCGLLYVWLGVINGRS